MARQSFHPDGIRGVTDVGELDRLATMFIQITQSDLQSVCACRLPRRENIQVLAAAADADVVGPRVTRRTWQYQPHARVLGVHGIEVLGRKTDRCNP